MSGNWGEVWDSLACRGAGEADRRKAAKANDVAEEPADDDMFARVGVAAE